MIQQLIYKIHSARLRKAKWNLTLPLDEARRNDEVVPLGDSQVLRWIDELNGICDSTEAVEKLKKEIKNVRKRENTIQNRNKLKDLYKRLEDIQFKKDYLCLIIDREKDYWRACNGFTINETRYVRLVGTNGGIKNSTIVFVSDKLVDELRRRMDNGRDQSMELVPAKFEAYRALVCSGSTPLSLPKGVAVVNDCITHFKADVININDQQDGEPVMEFEHDADIELNDSDGYGLMLPSLAERWSQELGLDYIVSGATIRFAWTKGMVFPFDFLDFANNVAGTRIIKDAWGNDIDLSEVELVLTTSMVKLFDSYPDCESFMRHSIANHYTFCATKECPKTLEGERSTNYQFVQPYDFSDEQIEQLVSPTVEMIRDVLGGDWRRAVLYLKGTEIDEADLDTVENDFAKALMVCPELINDQYVRKSIFSLMKNRIDRAKIGVLNIHANYSIISGDPYSLCQSMFGLEVTGLLKAGELYNKYWVDAGADKVSCFRAPMTAINNIRKMTVSQSPEAAYWYRYMNRCTILNSWDTTTHALNGADKDGDLIFITDNPVLVGCLDEQPALMCAQRKANKIVPTEHAIIASNIMSFGDEIGKITNRITAMFEAQANYEVGSPEWKILEYRIRCGQLYQQNSIDKAKGIVAKPMPKNWYDKGAILKDGVTDPAKINCIVDRKPYFMTYIYAPLKKQYNTYVSNTKKKAMREFRKDLSDLLNADPESLSSDEREFVHYYYLRMPVGGSDCTMNRICHYVEKEFDGYVTKHKSPVKFDYTVMKSGAKYSQRQYKALERLYHEYNKRLQSFMQYIKTERVDDEARIAWHYVLDREFKAACSALSSNRFQLCDILLDVCYRKEGSKSFVWAMCADEIVENLLNKNDGIIYCPVEDADGDVEFAGRRFRFEEKTLGDDIEWAS